MHRDDAALARQYRRVADAIMKTGQFDVEREKLLVELCTARNRLVVDALSFLVGHPDAGVAARARQALTDLH
jgi:hypothetical protein